MLANYSSPASPVNFFNKTLSCRNGFNNEKIEIGKFANALPDASQQVGEQLKRSKSARFEQGATKETIDRKSLLQRQPSTNVSIAWLQDKSLMKSKVFAKRINGAAASIQKIIRGAQARRNIGQKIKEMVQERNAIRIQTFVRCSMHRHTLKKLVSVVRIQASARAKLYRARYQRTLAAIRVQTFARAKIERLSYKKLLATIRIQAIFRGWRTRMHHRLSILTKQLEQIQKQHQQELYDIENGKDIIELEELKFQQALEKKMQKEFKDINKEIAAVREENRELRENLEKMRKATDTLPNENFDLKRNTNNKGVRIRELNETIARREQEFIGWTNTCKSFRDRRNDYAAQRKRIKEDIIKEEKLISIYQRSIHHILYFLADNCKDMRLRGEVAALCEPLDNKKRKA